MNTVLEQKMSWVYLINLVFFFVPLFNVTFELWQYLSMAAALLLFLVCYFTAYRSSFDQMHWPVLGIISVAALITPVNPGSISMFAYAGFFIAFAYPLRRYLLSLSAVALLLIALELGLNLHWPYFLHFGIPVLIGVSFFGRVERQRLLHQRSEQRSADEIKQLATMVERERIGRDLHDILGHTLSSIVLKADLAQKLLSHQQQDAAQAQLTELSQIARDALSQVRQSVSGFKHQGLTAEVAKLLARLRDAGFVAELSGDIPTLAKRQESAIILALTELVTNVIRHSRGQHCTLKFEQQSGMLNIVLSDDGNCANITEGNGLTGLRERLAALGGKLDIMQHAGTEACMRLPLKELKA